MIICIGCSKQCSYCLVNRLCNECNTAIDICNKENNIISYINSGYQSIWNLAAIEKENKNVG